MGQKTVLIRCLCGAKLVAYLWSLCGCGKKCSRCGTVMGSGGFVRLANGMTAFDIGRLQ
jgi:hypothetical protein